MAASFNWAKRFGTSPGTIADLGSSGNLANFMDEDSNTAANYSTKPITGSDNPNEGRSYENWFQAHFAGVFNKIDNLQFWMSTNFSPSTGLSVYWKGNNQTSYVTPVKTDSSIATASVPTSDPGTANVSIGGSLSGYLDAPGYSDYIVLQLDVAASTPPGDTSLAVFSIQYDEQ